MQTKTDADGYFRIDRILAGRYQITPIGKSLGMLGGIEIRPGDQLSRDFDIFLDHLELRMIDATTGAPLARRRFESSTGPVVSDEDGVLRWTPAPKGVFLTIPRDGKRVKLGPFGMKKGERVTRIDVKM